MKRYEHDYGVEFHSPTARRPLARAEAARVVAEPLPKRTSGHGKAIAVALAIVVAWALAWLVAFAS